MSGVSRDEADRVLRLTSRQRETHACYPCRKRKVKCDGNSPCRTCQKRKHPQICTYSDATPRKSITRQFIARSASPISPHAVSDQDSIQQDDSSKNYVYSGDNSVPSLLRSRAPHAIGSMAREVGSVLGLQNTFNKYPFMDSKSPIEKWKSLLEVLPQRTEVLKCVACSI
jgi:Fungal Zn(2)-Cys(6) binuclear cluster domain